MTPALTASSSAPSSTAPTSSTCSSRTRPARWSSATSPTSRPACCRRALATTRQRPSPTTSSAARPRARSATSRAPATSTTRRPSSSATSTRSMRRTTGRVNDQLKLVIGLRADRFKGDRPDLNPKFVDRYGFANDTGFDALGTVLLPRLRLHLRPGRFQRLLAAQGAGRRRHLLGRRSAGLVRQRLPEQRLRQCDRHRPSRPTARPARSTSSSAASSPAFQAASRLTALPAQPMALAIPSRSIPTSRCRRCFAPTSASRPNLNFAPTGFLSGWRVNLDYIYSKYRDPFTIVDLSQTVDPAPRPRRLHHRRPADLSRDRSRPRRAAMQCWSTSTPARSSTMSPRPASRPSRDDELMLTNSGGYRTHVAVGDPVEGLRRAASSPRAVRAISRSAMPIPTRKDRRNMYNSTAGSNYDQTAAFDRQNPGSAARLLRKQAQRHFLGQPAREVLRRFRHVARLHLRRPSGPAVQPDLRRRRRVQRFGSRATTMRCSTSRPGRRPEHLADLRTRRRSRRWPTSPRTSTARRNMPAARSARNSCSNDWYYDLDLSAVAADPGSGAAVRLALRSARQAHRLCDVRQLPEPARRQREHSAPSQLRRAPGSRGNQRSGCAGPLCRSPSSLGERAFNEDNFINYVFVAVADQVWRQLRFLGADGAAARKRPRRPAYSDRRRRISRLEVSAVAVFEPVADDRGDPLGSGAVAIRLVRAHPLARRAIERSALTASTIRSGTGSDQDHVAAGDRLGPLGALAQHQQRHAKRRAFLLDAA